MKPYAMMVARVLKRLRTAVGYRELGMIGHALDCLSNLEALGDIGPYGLIADILRDEFSKQDENGVSAVAALEIVACMLPPQGRRAIQLTLATCYGSGNERGRTFGDSARGANLEERAKPAA